jgi:hypothetical protein
MVGEEPAARERGSGTSGADATAGRRDEARPSTAAGAASWLEGSAESSMGDGGLRWSFEFDLAGVLAAIGRPLEAAGDAGQEEILAAGDGDESACVDLAGVVAECMPAGPGLAAWLSAQVPGGAADRDLAGLAAAFRKVASWAQAGELAMVAQVAARSAGRDAKIGLAAGGRPAWVSRDAAAAPPPAYPQPARPDASAGERSRSCSW